MKKIRQEAEELRFPPTSDEIATALAVIARNPKVAQEVLGPGTMPFYDDLGYLTECAIYEAIKQHYTQSGEPIEKVELATRAKAHLDVSGAMYYPHPDEPTPAEEAEQAIERIYSEEVVEPGFALEIWSRISEVNLQHEMRDELSRPCLPDARALLEKYSARLEAAQALAGGGEKRTKYLGYSALELEAADLRTGYVVDKLLAAGQLCLLGGPKKTLKTTLAVSIALSIAAGRKVFGRFDVLRCHRVTICSAESGLVAIRAIARRAARALGYTDLAAVPNVTFVPAVPRLNNASDWAEFVVEVVDRHAPEVLVLDPAYKMFDGEGAENIFAMGALLDVLDQCCQSRGITPILAHHLKTNRENRYGLADLDDLAYAGFAEQAAQWLLLTRREKYQSGNGSHKLWLQVGGRAGHDSGWALDVEEGDPEFPAARRLEIKLERAGESIACDRQRRSEEQGARKAAEVEARDSNYDEQIVQELETCPDNTASKETLRGLCHMSGAVVSGALARLIQADRVKKVPISVSRSIYQLVNQRQRVQKNKGRRGNKQRKK